MKLRLERDNLEEIEEGCGGCSKMLAVSIVSGMGKSKVGLKGTACWNEAVRWAIKKKVLFGLVA